MFNKFVKPLIAMFLVIAIPVIVFSIISNLPTPEPPLPQAYKALGYSAVDGNELEKMLSQSSQLRFGGDQAVVACPSTLVLHENMTGLCGYCKLTDVVVYPFWQDGFTKRIKAAAYDFRYFYNDALHKRYVLLSHQQTSPFDESSRLGQWRPSYGHWFMCQNSKLLDVNAYIEIVRNPQSKNKLKVDFKVLPYEALGIIRDQIVLPQIEKTMP